MLLLALYKSYVSQSGVSIFDPNGHEVELVFVRRRFQLHISPKRLVERIIQTFCTAIRSCVGVSPVREKAKKPELLRWPNTVFKRALADSIQHVHKDCKNKHAVDTAII